MVLALLMLLVGSNAEARQLRVAVVDTGLDMTDERLAPYLCDDGHEDFTDTGIKDIHGHGTHVAGIIIQNAGKADYCLIILKYYQPGKPTRHASLRAFKRAVELGVDIVNFSGGGQGSDAAERDVINSAPYIRFVVSAGNDGKRLGTDFFFYPASYRLPNMSIVGNLVEVGMRNRSSNYGSTITHWEIGTNVISYLPNKAIGSMSGTSQAAAVRTGKLIRELSRSNRNVQ